MKQQDYEKLALLVESANSHRRTSRLIKALADGLDPDSPDPESHNRTCLFNYYLTPWAAKLLLAAGADASYIDDNGYQPLHSANVKVAPLLLAAGAKIEARAHYPEVTPLIAHAIRGDAKMVKFLLDNGADVLARWDNYSNDVIGAAASSGNTDPKLKVGQGKIYRLVERRIAEGLILRRFKLKSLRDVRR